MKIITFSARCLTPPAHHLSSLPFALNLSQVRAAVVTSLCEAGLEDPAALSNELVNEMLKRIHDRKVTGSIPTGRVGVFCLCFDLFAV